MTPPDTEFMTLREASRDFDVSLSTLQRRRRAGDLEEIGAFRDDTGTWRVPRSGLVLLGFKEIMPQEMPGQLSIDDELTPPDTVPDEQPVTPPDTPSDTPVTPPASEVEKLREQLRDAEQRAAVAEAVATERLRTIEAQSSALRMLESNQPAQPKSEQTQEQPVPMSEPAVKEKWWQRLFR